MNKHKGVKCFHWWRPQVQLASNNKWYCRPCLKLLEVKW